MHNFTNLEKRCNNKLRKTNLKTIQKNWESWKNY